MRKITTTRDYEFENEVRELDQDLMVDFLKSFNIEGALNYVTYHKMLHKSNIPFGGYIWRIGYNDKEEFWRRWNRFLTMRAFL